VREGACVGGSTTPKPSILRLILNAAGLAAASPTLLFKNRKNAARLYRNESDWLPCDGMPVALKCASVSRWAFRKRRRKNSPCMRVEVRVLVRPPAGIGYPTCGERHVLGDGRRQATQLHHFRCGTHLLDVAGAEDTVARVDRHEKVSEHHRDDGHQLHHNVESRARGILERITDGVAHNSPSVRG
jgi:hypothetical protein